MIDVTMSRHDLFEILDQIVREVFINRSSG